MSYRHEYRAATTLGDTMADARAAGIHWRAGPAPNGRDGADDSILDVLDPAAPTILNEPEAQWHWASVAERRTGLTVWRSSPGPNTPAGDGWDPHVFSRAVFRNLDAHKDRNDGVYPTDVLLLNELNLDYERGESQGADFDTNADNWPGLYSRIADFLNGLLDNCKERAANRDNCNPRWWFQGWAPGHGHRDFFETWGPVAKRYDGICLHAYDGVDAITDEIRWYAQQFPEHPLLLGEWNTANMDPDVRPAEDERIRARLGRLCDRIPRLQCCYFIWRWERDTDNKYGIEDNDGRLALWSPGRELPADGFPVTFA
jgi:hypothetical protein